MMHPTSTILIIIWSVNIFLPLYGTVVLEPTNYVNSGCKGDNLTFFCNVSGTSLWWSWTRPEDDSPSRKLFTDLDALQMPSQVGDGTATLLAKDTTYLYSSLHFTLYSRHNGTRIGCGPVLDRLVNRLVVVEVSPPPTPQQLNISDYYNDTNTSTVTIEWENMERSATYLIHISNTSLNSPPAQSLLTTDSTAINITLSYNIEYRITVQASNCRGNSNITAISFTLIQCFPPSAVNGVSISPYTATTEGSVIVLKCEEGLVPEESIMAVCGNDRRWYPDPTTLNCTPNTTSGDVTTSDKPGNCNTTEGMNITTEKYKCTTTQLRNWHMVAAASGLTGVLFLSICVISGVIIRRKSAVKSKDRRVDIVVYRERTSHPEEYNHLHINSECLLQSMTSEEVPEYSVLNNRFVNRISAIELKDAYESTIPQYTSTLDESSRLTKSDARGHVVYGKSGCKVKGYSHDSTREDNVPYYSMVKVKDNGREYTDYEEAVADATTQSDKSKATKGIVYSKLHPTHPSDLLLNLDTLLIQLCEIYSKWEEIGAALGISQEYLTKIKDVGKHGTEFDCLVEVCDKWLKDRAKPTWKALSKALDKINCHELSKKILKIYDTGELPELKSVVTEDNSVCNSNYFNNNIDNGVPPLPPKLLDPSAPPVPTQLFDLSESPVLPQTLDSPTPPVPLKLFDLSESPVLPKILDPYAPPLPPKF